MAWTGDPVWLADVLRAEGLSVIEAPGWRDRGQGDFKNIWGVICHHTGGSNTPVSEIIYGTPALKGLLSQIHLAKDGTVALCGVGVAWHAGQGSYPGLPEDDANWHTIGIEAVNSGTEGWSPVQYDAYVRTCAAIVRKLGYGAERVIGHKEWAGRKQGKWDPGGIDMDQFRRDVAARLNPPTPAPPAPTGEPPMSAADVQEIKDFIVAYLAPLISDVKDIRYELTGARDNPNYPLGVQSYPGHPSLYDLRAGVPDGKVFHGTATRYLQEIDAKTEMLVNVVDRLASGERAA